MIQIESIKPLVIIPARGGSKGIPRKNVKFLGDKPLIKYAIDAARNLFSDDIICVSTDDAEIKCIVEKFSLEVPFVRPLDLASDEAGTNEVLLHAIDYYEKNGYEPNVIILLQPTSPFRKSIHIKEALELYNSSVDMVVSVKETTSNPYYVLFEEDNNGYLKKSKSGNYKRRQDCPKVWEYNGAIYIINAAQLKRKPISSFEKIIKYEMNDYSSHDLDTLFDWSIAEILLKQNENK